MYRIFWSRAAISTLQNDQLTETMVFVHLPCHNEQQHCVVTYLQGRGQDFLGYNCFSFTPSGFCHLRSIELHCDADIIDLFTVSLNYIDIGWTTAALC